MVTQERVDCTLNRAKNNLAVGVTLSPLTIHLHAIILTNQVKTSWPYSLGIPSNAVNILYKNNKVFCCCWSFQSFSQSWKQNSFATTAYTDNVFFFAYGHSKRLICVRFVFFHFFYILCLLSLSFLGGGVISINLGYKGGPPKQISNDEAGWSSNYIEATRQIPPAPPRLPPTKKKSTVLNCKKRKDLL